MTDHPEFVARQLVRSYSDSLRAGQGANRERSPPKQRLEEAFVEEVEREDALAALLQNATSSPTTSATLTERFAELEDTVKEFHKMFPDIAKENASSKSFSWSSLNQTILRMQAEQEAKLNRSFGGKSKKKFHGVCDAINNHISVLKILPQGDKYTAPICGSLELIVKASVNHERVGEEFVAALKEIDDIVQAVQRELSLYSASFLLDLSVQLCCQIIKFLAFPLKWYTQKRHNRMFASFNENLSDRYQTQIKEIRRISDNIRRGVHYCSEVEMRGVARKLPELTEYFNDVFMSMQRDFHKREEERWGMFHQAIAEQNRMIKAGPQEYFSKMSQLLAGNGESGLGEPIKQILDKGAHDFATGLREARIAVQEVPGPVIATFDRNFSSTDSRRQSLLGTRSEVEQASMKLNPFFDFDNIAPPALDATTFVEREGLERLQDWTAQITSSILGIFGPTSPLEDDPARILAMNYVRAAKGAGIPCVTYFCSISHEPAPAGRLRETVGLVALLYALLKQLVLYLPHQLPQDHGISQQEVEALDGTLRTWDGGISLLGKLLTLAESPYLLVSIHGFEVLEHDATIPYLGSLLDVFRKSSRMDPGNELKLKVLFTTSGVSQILWERMSEDEICDISRGSAARKPGRQRKGRRNMADVELFEG